MPHMGDLCNSLFQNTSKNRLGDERVEKSWLAFIELSPKLIHINCIQCFLGIQLVVYGGKILTCLVIIILVGERLAEFEF